MSITFHLNLGYWECDLVRVRDAALTDDVVEFMAGRLQKLSDTSQHALKLAACIGNQFDLETLAIVREEEQEEVAAELWNVLQEGLILPISETYKFFQGDLQESQTQTVTVGYRFLHDRVQQAAYLLISEDQRAETHYHIGQLLLQQIPTEDREERIFELVSQLNYGTSLITEQQERDELARLNLVACRKARAATAYEVGREYASTGLSLLGDNAWQRQYEMCLAFHDLATELASLCGDFEAMKQFAQTVITQARTLLEQANVCRIRIQANASQHKLLEAITIAQQFLQQLGVSFPDSPTQKDIQQAFTEIDRLIGDRDIEDFVNLPMMAEIEKMVIVQIAISIMPAVYMSGSPLYPLLVALSVKLSIQYGNTSDSAIGYVTYGLLSCNLRQDVDTGVKFGQLALKVVSALDAKTVEPDVLNVIGLFISIRKSHLKETLPFLQKGYVSALEVGILQYVGFNASMWCFNSFWCSQNLTTLEQEFRSYVNSLMELNQVAAANWCRIYWQSAMNCLGNARQPSILSGEALEETELLPQLFKANDFFGLYFFYLYKLMLCYLFDEVELAQNHIIEIEKYLRIGAGTIGEPLLYFYASLTSLSALNSSTKEIQNVFEKVKGNQIKLQQKWANYAPMNHQHKVDLVEAEKCRMLGQKLEAIELYDRAIAGAKENEYIQEEALANELFAKFYLDWRREKEASVYMQEAYYCYARWGAKAKTDRLEQIYPQLLAPILQQQQVEFNPLTSLESLTQTFSATQQSYTSSSTNLSETLDFTAVLQAGQALSSTLELDPLLSKIVRIILTNAGAQKVALLIPKEEQWQLRAIAQLEGNSFIETSTELQPLTPESPLPIRLVRYVKNTQEPVLINEGKTEISGILEGYLLKHQPQSVLCTPLLNQNKLVAILYLEHPTTQGVFTSNRQTIVQFLCAQAAIALENAQLYDRVKQTQLQLVQSEKMSALGNLVAGVAHEINNPTGFLQGNIQPAQDYVQDLLSFIDLFVEKYAHNDPQIQEEIEEIDLEFIREDLPKLLESMNVGVERIRNISNSLRIFSRQDREYKTAFNIHEGIESTLLILKHRTKANEERPAIQTLRNYEEIPEVQCFPGQLNQVVMNILANAIDAFEEANQGKTYAEIKANPNCITIRTSIAEEQVKIQIQDNGCGMKPEVRERIFEQGFTTKGVGKGTGLGMAIARQIVEEKHGGTLICQSELGKGTTFTILLPLT